MAAQSESEARDLAARARVLLEEAAPLVWEVVTWITPRDGGNEEAMRRHKIVCAALGPLYAAGVKLGFDNFTALQAAALKQK